MTLNRHTGGDKSQVALETFQEHHLLTSKTQTCAELLFAADGTC